jgi:hypothetical protein
VRKKCDVSYDHAGLILLQGGGFFLAPWKDDAENEETIKTEVRPPANEGEDLESRACDRVFWILYLACIQDFKSTV